MTDKLFVFAKFVLISYKFKCHAISFQRNTVFQTSTPLTVQVKCFSGCKKWNQLFHCSNSVNEVFFFPFPHFIASVTSASIANWDAINILPINIEYWTIRNEKSFWWYEDTQQNIQAVSFRFLWCTANYTRENRITNKPTMMHYQW